MDIINGYIDRVIVMAEYIGYPVLHITIKSVGIFSRNLGVVLRASLAKKVLFCKMGFYIMTNNELVFGLFEALGTKKLPQGIVKVFITIYFQIQS